MLLTTGICHICGKRGTLTYEHIPPKAAFNKHKITITPGSELTKLIQNDILPEEMFQNKKVKKVYKQRGMGAYTLCEGCNTFTGHFYADAYVEMVRQAIYIIHTLGGSDIFKSGEKYIFQFRKLYPLRIIKEIFTMFFSVNSDQFSKAQPELQKFVLNKEICFINKDKYAIYAHILSGILARYSGISGLLNVYSGQIRLISEVAAHPFGFVLEIDPKEKNRLLECDIIDFAKFKYDEQSDIRLALEVKESNYYMPLDYRSKNEIFNTRLKNILQETANQIAKKL